MPTKPLAQHYYHYSTSEVLERTLISRASLTRYIKEGKFPAPKLKAGDHGSRGRDWYDKNAVDEWIQKNSKFVTWKQNKIAENISVSIEAKDMKHIREACELLSCDEIVFIRDAAIWKASLVKKLTASENKYEDEF